MKDIIVIPSFYGILITLALIIGGVYAWQNGYRVLAVILFLIALLPLFAPLFAPDLM